MYRMAMQVFILLIDVLCYVFFFKYNTIFKKNVLGLRKMHLEVALRKTWKVEVSNNNRDMLNLLLM